MLNGLISHRTIGLIVGPIDVLAIVGSTIARRVRTMSAVSRTSWPWGRILPLCSSSVRASHCNLWAIPTSDSSPIGQAGSCSSVGFGGRRLGIYLATFSAENKWRIFARPTMPSVIVSSLEYGPGAAKRLSLIR